MAALTIHQAAGRGALQLVQRMVLHENAQVDARDKHGKTPLMHAAQWGHHSVVLFLLETGACVNRVDFAGRTALQWTAPTGASLRTIAVLLERGADPSLGMDDGEEDGMEDEGTSLGDAGGGGAVGRRRPRSAHFLQQQHRHRHRHLRGGATFLMRACSFGYDQIVRLLLQHKNSDVKARDSLGRTALHYAASATHPNSVRMLLESGADPTITDGSGRTALCYASEDEPLSIECAALLEAACDSHRARTLLKARALLDTADGVGKAMDNTTEATYIFAARQRAALAAAPVYLKGRVEEGQDLPRVEVAGEDEKVLACLKYVLGLEGGGGVHFEGQEPPPPGMVKEVFVELCEMLVAKWDRDKM